MMQQYLMDRCAESVLYYINTFVYTFSPLTIDGVTHKKVSNPFPHMPFITWPIQDTVVLEMVENILKGEDFATDKSRQMGASWLVIAVLDWLWLFHPDSKILELSRIEDYVDKPGNDKALFWKHDYIHDRLPAWMRPPGCLPGGKHRVRMRITNIANGSVIDGEATTKNAARGTTRTVIMADEFGAVENGRAMREAMGEAAACCIINSTPKAGSEYSRWVTSGAIKVVRLPWWEHPGKGKDRYVELDPATKLYHIRSPWYNMEEEEHDTAYMAKEHDMNHIEAGRTFFDIGELDVYIGMFCKEPTHSLAVKFVEGVANDVVHKLLQARDTKKVMVVRGEKNHWKIWGQLKDGRPDQSIEYIFGIDISKGQGASNSIISVWNADTGEKVAEWANSNVPPYEFAPIVAAAALWFGGRNPRRLPFIIWESNGDPGIDFGRIMVLVFRYPYYYADETTGSRTAKKTKKYGFHSNTAKKAELLGFYREQLMQRKIINRSEAAMEECKGYIEYEGGGLGPSCLMAEKSGARLAHGDRTVADSLGVWSLRKKTKKRKDEQKIPTNCFEYRFRQHKRLLQRSKQTKYAFGQKVAMYGS